MMTTIAAFGEGMRRVGKAPAILAGVLVLTFLVALPLGITLRGMLAEHLGASLAARDAASGVNYGWWQEFSAQASGLGVTFKPTIIGFGAVLDNLTGWFDNQPRPVVVLGVAAVVRAAVDFLRRRHHRPLRAQSACSGATASSRRVAFFFFRFLRLAVAMQSELYAFRMSRTVAVPQHLPPE